jgi:hypothetical protein
MLVFREFTFTGCNLRGVDMGGWLVVDAPVTPQTQIRVVRRLHGIRSKNETKIWDFHTQGSPYVSLAWHSTTLLFSPCIISWVHERKRDLGDTWM